MGGEDRLRRPGRALTEDKGERRHGMDWKNSPRRSRQGNVQGRAAQDGLGASVPRPARTRNQISRRGDRPQGRSAFARQQADHGDRAAHRHIRLHRRALFGHHQGRAHRRDRVLQLRRLLRQRDEERRLRHDHLRGPFAQTRLSLSQQRRRQAHRRRPVLG